MAHGSKVLNMTTRRHFLGAAAGASSIVRSHSEIEGKSERLAVPVSLGRKLGLPCLEAVRVCPSASALWTLHETGVGTRETRYVSWFRSRRSGDQLTDLLPNRREFLESELNLGCEINRHVLTLHCHEGGGREECYRQGQRGQQAVLGYRKLCLSRRNRR